MNQITPGEASEEVLRDVVPSAVLLPYQQAWINDKSQVKICEKSRRIGLSWAEAADAAITAASASGMDVFYVAYNQDMTQQFIKDVAFWAKWFNLAAGAMEEVVLKDEDRDVRVYQIQFASGYVVQALSSHPRNLRSKKGRAIFDEFAFVDNPDELLKAGLAFLIWGGDLRVISTHNGVDHPFNRLIEDCRAGKKPYAVHRIDFETAVEQGLYRRICLMRGIEWTLEGEIQWEAEIRAFYSDGAGEELDCEPKASAGKYFSRTMVERVTSSESPVVRLTLKPEFISEPQLVRDRFVADWCSDHLRPLLDALDPRLVTVYGMDFARVSDLSAFVPAQIQRDLTRRVPFILKMRGVPYEAQKDILVYLVSRLPRFAAGAHDASGNGAYLAEAGRTRFGSTRIHEIKLASAWYMENFPKYKSGLEEAKVLLPADADVVDDHLDVERVRGVPLVPQGKKRTATADGLPRHGDVAVACVLMWFASLNQGAPIDFEASDAREGVAMADRFIGGGSEIDEDTGFGIVTSGTGSDFNY